MSSDITASAWADAQVERVRDIPAARLELLGRTYNGPVGRAPRHLPFRRAAMSFMRWQVHRGVLAPLDATTPGSPWWRQVNERLLRDGCEAVARSGGHGGVPSSSTIDLWMQFVATPTARTWYRAHNGSIVAAFLQYRELAAAESLAERFFLNVVLLRMLFAHALVAAPRLSLGRFAICSSLLGDPRLGMAGAFLSLARILPDRYPFDGSIEAYVADEHNLGQMLDYGIIVPRLQRLYQWSAEELGEPGLGELIREGSPIYAWSFEDRHVWNPERTSISVRMLRRIVPVSSRW
ncbi:MAG: hypothetical protein K8T91_19040 [Planctomycetes bacterium]|nr:hypothetical protein [Planctomycetota bacterium]